MREAEPEPEFRTLGPQLGDVLPRAPAQWFSEMKGDGDSDPCTLPSNRLSHLTRFPLYSPLLSSGSLTARSQMGSEVSEMEGYFPKAFSFFSSKPTYEWLRTTLALSTISPT